MTALSSLPPEVNHALSGRMDRLKACEKCLTLSGYLLLWEVAVAQGTTGQYQGKYDFFLGTAADVEARSSDGCKSCRSILACSSHHQKLLEEHGMSYGVSAHFRREQPLVNIAWGNINGNNEDPTQRRSHFINLRLDVLLSTNPVLAKTVAGRGRPYDLDGYNVSLIRRWIERCDKHHESTCSAKYKDLLLPKARLSLIDVEDLCIVTPDEPVRYAALSYVWGAAEVPMAKKANITFLRLPGAFLKGGYMELPATIYDVVRLCGSIGIRYLWVDSMCIVQDDMESKMEQINAMSSIYANAYLTLVALTSEGANSGIPRISQGRSSSDRSPFVHLPCQTLINASQGAIGLPPMIHARTMWTKRAWTLQETVLSKRMLCLSFVASWACGGAHWSEDLEDLSEIEGQHALTEKRDKLYIPEWPDMSQYSRLASEYAARRLTMPDDTLSAFEGILAPMRQLLPGGFLFGIPEFIFDIGLLWQHRRRGAKPRSGLDWAGTKHEFPSWSWISHHALHLQNFWQADFMCPQPDLIVSPLVKWKKQNKATGNWEDVDNSYHVVRKHFENPDTPTPDNWTKHINEQGLPNYQSLLFSRVQPAPMFSYPIPPQQRPPNLSTSYLPHLLFEGSLARVRFEFRGTKEEREVSNKKLLDDALVPEMDIVSAADGNWIGRIRLNMQQGDKLPGDEEEQEVIAISEAKITVKAGQDHSLTTEAKDWIEIKYGDSPWYHFVNVFWIGRTKDDKVYRKALGRIWLEAWEKMTVEQSAARARFLLPETTENEGAGSMPSLAESQMTEDELEELHGKHLAEQDAKAEELKAVLQKQLELELNAASEEDLAAIKQLRARMDAEAAEDAREDDERLKEIEELEMLEDGEAMDVDED
ncbi:hypothetical protein LLEC1_02609 [Akanthomyces lecanii]|uniref:Heterokaryon incompatibility domain-containing protein n=1 Tax=Cordyceps confragosa TaxID=2714763 RepID=A0A179IIF0_CORDF|nr:hypothetical protein LLEC1_02609 [Akanthomyces lecanii]